jgi:hypothetical protein
MSSRAYLERWWVPGDPLPGIRSGGSWTAQPMVALKADHRCLCEITEEDWRYSRCSARWTPQLLLVDEEGAL